MIKCQMQLKFLIKHDETKQIEEKPHINNSWRASNIYIIIIKKKNLIVKFFFF